MNEELKPCLYTAAELSNLLHNERAERTEELNALAVAVGLERVHEAGSILAAVEKLAAAPAPVASEAVAQGGGVDVEKVMALVRDYGDNCFVEGRDEVTSNRAFARGEQRRVAAEIRAILASAPAVPVGDGWLPIETAPKDGTVIIATGFNYGESSEPRHYCMARWEQGEWREANEWNVDSSLAYLTHWQPAPPAPSVDGEG